MGRIFKKKNSFFLLVIFLVGNIGLDPDISQESFSVSVGNTIKYDVHETFIDSSFGSDFFYYDGIYVELVKIPVPSEVTIVVDEVSGTSVIYTRSHANLNHHDTCVLNIMIPFLKLIAYGTTIPIISESHWSTSLDGPKF